jgi:hypothetical protein
MKEIPLNDGEEKNCRPCEIALALILLMPLSTFVVMSFISDDAQYWGFLGILIGLPLSLVAIKILFMDPWSQNRGLLPPSMLYFVGCVCLLGPFLPNPNYAVIGFGLMTLKLARHRQLQGRRRAWQ